MEYDIFISYARKDLGVVQPIVKEIESRTGVKPWIDLDGIETGSQFQDKIINAINKCKVFVFMASPNALRSEWTKKEIAFAKLKQKKICPIVATDCELPDWFLFEYATVDVINYRDELQREKFLRNMAEWTGNRVRAKEDAELQCKQTENHQKSSSSRQEEGSCQIVHQEGDSLENSRANNIPERKEQDSHSDSKVAEASYAEIDARRSVWAVFFSTFARMFSYKPRSGRKEFIIFTIFVYGVIICTKTLEWMDCECEEMFNVLGCIFFASYLPLVALSVRRSFDCGWSRWAACGVLCPITSPLYVIVLSLAPKNKFARSKGVEQGKAL